MRSRAAKDEETLRIVSALVGAAVLVGVPFLVLVLVTAVTDAGDDTLGSAFTLLGPAYLVLVVALLLGRSRDGR